MTTHITLTTFVVFFGLVAFGVVVFTLAHFASRGAFSPGVTDDAAPEEPGNAMDEGEGMVPAQDPARGQDVPSASDS